MLCLPAVLDQLGQASGGRVAPVAAVRQLGTDALSGLGVGIVAGGGFRGRVKKGLRIGQRVGVEAGLKD